mmetsp:Transcript_31347/g.63612  ORF Transcript_31347/g.63612 Transcript_31347/m.63612 type:complete len:255 (-) Transcript_31347:141-905(-)
MPPAPEPLQQQQPPAETASLNTDQKQASPLLVADAASTSPGLVSPFLVTDLLAKLDGGRGGERGSGGGSREDDDEEEGGGGVAGDRGHRLLEETSSLTQGASSSGCSNDNAAGDCSAGTNEESDRASGDFARTHADALLMAPGGSMAGLPISNDNAHKVGFAVDRSNEEVEGDLMSLRWQQQHSVELGRGDLTLVELLKSLGVSEATAATLEEEEFDTEILTESCLADFLEMKIAPADAAKLSSWATRAKNQST